MKHGNSGQKSDAFNDGMSKTTPGTKRTRKKKQRQNDYIGKAGQLAVMAEFALRGYNVALPEIDKGDDIYVVNQANGRLWRIQVKGATLQEKNRQYQVVIQESQITKKPVQEAQDLHFVFALRQEDRWQFIVVSRVTLKRYIDGRSKQGRGFGSVHEKRRTLTITFPKRGTDRVKCSDMSWTKHLGEWGEWPRLDHASIIASGEAEVTDLDNDIEGEVKLD